MHASTTVRRWLASAGCAAALLGPATHCAAIVVSAADPTTAVPAEVPVALAADQFLLPIAATGAAGLQSWSFSLGFDASVVQQVDLGGWYFGVYAASFSTATPVLSSITSSGFLLDGLLDGVAGFSGGVTGDGLLAYIGFAYQPGREGADPGFTVGGVTVAQPVPEPGSLALVLAGLLALGQRQQLRRLRPLPGKERACNA